MQMTQWAGAVGLSASCQVGLKDLEPGLQSYWEKGAQTAAGLQKALPLHD